MSPTKSAGFQLWASRRQFLKTSGAAAAVTAAGGVLGRPAQAAREKELNILCWEGYNSAEVLDPFRSSNDATVKAESLTNDPTMINRLRAGETNVWDLINVNNPWARKIMHPEGLIKPLDRATFEPYFEKMLPAFKPPYRWAMSDDGNDLLGMAQRFGPYSFVVNTDKISRATAEDQGWDLWSDDANAEARPGSAPSTLRNLRGSLSVGRRDSQRPVPRRAPESGSQAAPHAEPFFSRRQPTARVGKQKPPRSDPRGLRRFSPDSPRVCASVSAACAGMPISLRAPRA